LCDDRTYPARLCSTPNTNNDYEGFYSSTFYVDNLLKYLNDRDEQEAEKPFFAYLPFAAPHWPLQCSAEDRDAYKGRYDAGPDALRLERLQGLKDKGLIPSDIKPHDVIAPEVSDWDSLDAEGKRMSSRSMEVYAGMVTAMDREIGKVIDRLEQTGELDSELHRGTRLG
jgi:arylsulfatase A-like enzyme